MINIKQGYCYLANMNPPRKSKPGKIRPVVVIQSDDITQFDTPGIITIPLTTQLMEENILRVRMSKSENLKLTKVSDAVLDQVHTIDRSDFLEELGPIASEDFQKIQTGIKFIFGF